MEAVLASIVEAVKSAGAVGWVVVVAVAALAVAALALYVNLAIVALLRRKR